MEEHYSVLIAIQENLPDSYSEKNLQTLEHLVTRYQEILNHIAQTADPENVTSFYRERNSDLEAELKDAKYGHDEKQRVVGFDNAKHLVNAGITALLFQLNKLENKNYSDGNISI